MAETRQRWTYSKTGADLMPSYFTLCIIVLIALALFGLADRPVDDLRVGVLSARWPVSTLGRRASRF